MKEVELNTMLFLSYYKLNFLDKKPKSNLVMIF